MITELRLQNFRSYIDESFEFEKGVNIIVGPNASGKTNLLEAILFISQGKSYRVKDSELINFNKNWSKLTAKINTGMNRTIKITLNNKQYEIDEKKFKRLGHNYKIPVVLFEPNHLLLLNGPPEHRRSYLDDLLEQVIPEYNQIRRQYKRTLLQRNFLLKNSLATSNDFFPWNVRISQLADKIIKYRTDLINEIQKIISSLYQELADSKIEVSIEYLSQFSKENYSSKLLNNLENNLKEDKRKGYTTSGPHRDDFIIKYDNHPSSEVASRGEIRSALLSLKIIEAKIIYAYNNELPIFLLDDVFSELDGKRRKAFLKYINLYQTFITTPDIDIVSHYFSNSSNILLIE